MAPALHQDADLRAAGQLQPGRELLAHLRHRRRRPPWPHDPRMAPLLLLQELQIVPRLFFLTELEIKATPSSSSSHSFCCPLNK